jgi:hypothetical protein
MNTAFNQWWDESPVNPNNPYTQNTPAYWAWEGWCAGVKAERERIIATNAPEIERVNAHIKALEAAVLAEREAIIAIASDLYYWDHTEKLIEAIRNRSNT